MMSPTPDTNHNNSIRAKPSSSSAKDETLVNSNTKASSTQKPLIQDQQPLNCPRCDSPNTKFCYYNNYSLTQPRHFCKTCRRYWTRGGALRNVPIGGGCRKNKKVKTSSSSSRLFSGGGDSFQGFLSPAMDYQLDGSGSGSGSSAFPSRSLYTTSNHHFPSFGIGEINNNSATNNNPSCCTIINDPPSGGNPNLLGSLSMGFDNYLKQGDHIGNYNNSTVNVRANSLTSSIESLSSINQDLHLKLQQQRMALLLGGGGDQNQHDHHKTHVVPSSTLDIIEKPQSILFQNLEVSRPEGSAEFGDHVSRNGGNTTGGTIEWSFDNNAYAAQAQVRVTTTDPVNGNSHNWNNGLQAWSDLPQYNALH